MRLKSILSAILLFAFAVAGANKGFTIKTIVIDAGHGGKDPGAIGYAKNHEKDIALKVALKLGEDIEKNFPDVQVIYTRKTDVFLELHERAEIANKNKADLFIAVHCNSSTNKDVYGTSTYVLGLHRTEANLEVAKRENAVILLEDDRDKNYDFDPNTPEGHIIMSMKQNAFLDQSIDMASKIEGEYEHFCKRKSLGVKQAGFYVLYKTTMPSLLSEIGFISNPNEEKFLNSDKGQDQIAASIFNAFKTYKEAIESISGGGQTAATEEKKKEEKPVEATATKIAPKEEKVAEKKEEPAAASTEQGYVITKSGKKIRKPIENGSGGGKYAAGTGEETTVKAEEPVKKEVVQETPKEEKPVVAEAKPEAKNTEPPAKTETKPEVKTEVKKEPVATTPPPVKEEVKSTPPPKAEIKSVAAAAPVSKSTEGITFKIQICALKGPFKYYATASERFGAISTEQLSNGFTRYYVYETNSYGEVKKDLANVVAHGYKDAFIVGVKNGKRLGVEEMKALETP